MAGLPTVQGTTDYSHVALLALHHNPGIFRNRKGCHSLTVQHTAYPHTDLQVFPTAGFQTLNHHIPSMQESNRSLIARLARVSHIPEPPPLIPTSKHLPAAERVGSITQGTPIPLLTTAAYGPEHGKGHPGSMSMGLQWTMDPSKYVPFAAVKQEQLSPRAQSSPPESSATQSLQDSPVSRASPLCLVQGGSITRGTPGTRVPSEPAASYRGSITQGTPAEVLYKGSITRIIAEDNPNRSERAQKEASSKGHVIYEGKSGHVLSYDGIGSENCKEERRTCGALHEIAGLKRNYEMMEGGLAWGIPARDSLPSSYEGLMVRAVPRDRLGHHDPKERPQMHGSITQGIPRSHAEAHEECLRREVKQMKRESTPPRVVGEASKARPREGPIPTVKEAGRSIHEIPREGSHRTAETSALSKPSPDGSISQGTPLKCENSPSGSAAKKHDVRSLISSPGRGFHPTHQLDVMSEGGRGLERVRYTESPTSRPSSIVSSAGSIVRGAPVIIHEAAKSHISPRSYEDYQAAHRTPLHYNGPLHRGSPVSMREAASRQQEGKVVSQEQKATPTPREMSSAKSPHRALPEHFAHSPYDQLLGRMTAADLYHGSIPLTFDPAALARGIPLEAATYCLPRHLSPAPGYPHPYGPYLLRGCPEAAAMETRQTILNDYITSQHMHHAATAAMAHRAEMIRGLSPREQALSLGYSTSPRGIIDLSQVPHLPVLVQPPAGSSSPPMDRITYIPGAPPHFTTRPYSSSPLSPGGVAHVSKMPGAPSSERERERERAVQSVIAVTEHASLWRSSAEEGTRPAAHPHLHTHSPLAHSPLAHSPLTHSPLTHSPLTHDNIQLRPSVLQNTGVKHVITSVESATPSVLRFSGSLPRGTSCYRTSCDLSLSLCSPGGYNPNCSDGMEATMPAGSPSLCQEKASHQPPETEAEVRQRSQAPQKVSVSESQTQHVPVVPERTFSPSQQPQLVPFPKGQQRFVTLAQHIDEVIIQDYTRNHPQQVSCQPGLQTQRYPFQQLKASSGLHQEYTHHCRIVPEAYGDKGNTRSRSPGSVSEDGIEAVSPVQSPGDLETSQCLTVPALYRDIEPEQRMESRSPGSGTQPPAFFSKLTESTSPMVKSKKQEIIKKLNAVSGSDSDYNIGQPGTEIFNMPATTSAGSVSSRSQSMADHSGNNMGLEDIIRKALMGKYDDRGEERSSVTSAAINPMAVNAGTGGQSEDVRCLPSTGGVKPALGGRTSTRKAQSPVPGLLYCERPASAHSDSDCHRHTPLTAQEWEDRLSSTGSAPFPYNTLTLRLPTGLAPASLVPPPAIIPQTTAASQQRSWDREGEPQPLLSSQYETLSDSE
uniref:nuclear receptor corepressor 2-like n=1 Tax=Pristiophorus japonicus TaxID=55135 RepID=UPI00398F28D1